MDTIIINVIIKHWGGKPSQLKEVISHEKKGFLIDCMPWVIVKSIESVGTVTTPYKL